jgi:hypothetical protein
MHEQIRQKWSVVSSKKSANGFKLIRINSECFADLFIGENDKEERCLILAVADEYIVKLSNIEREKISIELFYNPKYLVITLKDTGYFDIFIHLVSSLYQTIKDVKSASDYVPLFTSTVNQWIQFFTLTDNERLNVNEVKGLWGELFILKELIISKDDINSTLLAWKGPFDKSHDFEFDNKDLEIKTKSPEQISVKIASEHQLDIELGKDLHLNVLTLREDITNGASLSEQYIKIAKLIAERLGDINIFLVALFQKGLTPLNISDYDNLRFSAVKKETYDCLLTDFPKLTKPNVHAAISDITYKINLTTMDKFLIKMEHY